MDESQLLAYIMYTPIEKLPPMPVSIQNEKNDKLGVDILNLLESKKIRIKSMNENGLLIIEH